MHACIRLSRNEVQIVLSIAVLRASQASWCMLVHPACAKDMFLAAAMFLRFLPFNAAVRRAVSVDEASENSIKKQIRNEPVDKENGMEERHEASGEELAGNGSGEADRVVLQRADQPLV